MSYCFLKLLDVPLAIRMDVPLAIVQLSEVSLSTHRAEIKTSAPVHGSAHNVAGGIGAKQTLLYHGICYQLVHASSTIKA